MGASWTPLPERHEQLGRCPTSSDNQVRLGLGVRGDKGSVTSVWAEDTTSSGWESHIHVIAPIKLSVESRPGVG